MFNIDSKDIIYNPNKQELYGKTFGPVKIPDDAIPDNKIFPSRLISGYHALADESTALAWEQYMLSLARNTPGATGVYWCSALNSGNVGPNLPGRYWFGYLFGGGPINSSDFVPAPKQSGVVGARAFSILLLKE